MAKITRFLVGFRSSATVPKEAEGAIDAFIAEQQGLHEIRRLKGGQRVLEMAVEQAEKLTRQRPDLCIEEDLELKLLSSIPGLLPKVSQEITGKLRVRTVDEESNAGVDSVSVYCLGHEIAYKGVTDKNGNVDIDIHEPDLRHIIAAPRSGYWSKVCAPPEISEKSECEIRLQKLPPVGDYGWGFQLLGVDQCREKFTGKGIKIGLIDSGASTHENLSFAGGFNALLGKDAEWTRDEDGHGTHCAGILAAQGKGLKGMAPGSEIYPVKVYPGGRLSDFVEAVNWCIDNYMDLICIGVGSPFHTQQMEVVLLEAFDRGITCVAAAGNDYGPVTFPAAYDHVLAVTAMGKAREFPADSVHGWAMGELSGYEDLFFAAFSNFGQQIDFCAPGVAIQSTVPNGRGAWDGTSMSCAFVAGLAALVLEAYPEIRTGDAYQPHYLRRILSDTAIDLGLPRQMQGAGLISAIDALSEAFIRRAQEETDLISYKRSLKAALEEAKRKVEDLERELAGLNP